MVTLSCGGKFHAFALAEQLQKQELLNRFYTTYYSKKNPLLKIISGRDDKEAIDIKRVSTLDVLSILRKIMPDYYLWNNLFDEWVSGKLQNDNVSKVFIGWSGMSLKSITTAKHNGKLCILERGSAHIVVQNKILQEEYAEFGTKFSIDSRVINKELEEYACADIISIPSEFVKETFVRQGVDSKKLFVNPYGVSSFFNIKAPIANNRKFIILYLGVLSVQKAVQYLVRAINEWKVNEDLFEVWFVGKVKKELKQLLLKHTRPNWKFFGHVEHYRLPDIIKSADIAVLPSLQDGFGMVVPQLMACGVPVICSENTGAKMMIKDGENGFVVPVKSAAAIREKIVQVFENRELLNSLKANAKDTIKDGYTWDDYGNRYAALLSNYLR